MKIIITLAIYIAGMACVMSLPTKWFINKDAHLVFTFIWPLILPFLPIIGFVSLIDYFLQKRYDK
jgi:purine-cytosine permease-like protein